MSEAHARPTRVRYLILGLTMLTAALLYLDRYCISFAERYIREDLRLSNEAVGWLLSAFSWAYALGQVPAGFLADRFGARAMLTLYILLWSLFTALTGVAAGLAALLLCRLGIGAAQAGAYPASASLVGNWVSPAARGSASSLVALGGRFGGFVAPLLTALLIVAFVPATASSRLAPDDLLDYPWLCHRLADDATGLGGHILAGLPATDRPSTADQLRALADRLNEVIRGPNLARTYHFETAVLPREAKTLVALPPEALSDAERERLNRLLLETAYPLGIKKAYVAGWRPVMIAFGLAGLAVAGLFWLCFRDAPARHPLCNAAEVRLIEAGRPPAGKALRVPLGPLVRSGGMWLMCLAQLATNVGWVFLVTWLPRYLAEAHHVPIEERGLLASIPLLVGFAGMLSGGWATDRLTRAVGPRWGRALPLVLSRFLAALAYLSLLFDPGPYAATAALSVVAFATDFGSPATWAFMLDVGGRYVGSVLGWGNMWGNFGAALSPPLLNWVLGADRWPLVFLTCAAAFLVSGLCALGINAAVPIVPPEEQSS
jgi:MFS family permease